MDVLSPRCCRGPTFGPFCDSIAGSFDSMDHETGKGILAFLAQDASTRVFYYANAQLRKEDQNDEILRFVDFWKERCEILL